MAAATESTGVQTAPCPSDRPSPNLSSTYLTERDLASRFAVHRTTIWRWLKTYSFPEPVRFSPGCTRWRLADVEAWEAAQARGEVQR